MTTTLTLQSHNNNLDLSSNLQGFFNPQITLLIMQNFHSSSVLDLRLILSKVYVCHFDQVLEVLQHHMCITYSSKLKHKHIHIWGSRSQICANCATAEYSSFFFSSNYLQYIIDVSYEYLSFVMITPNYSTNVQIRVAAKI